MGIATKALGRAICGYEIVRRIPDPAREVYLARGHEAGDADVVLVVLQVDEAETAILDQDVERVMQLDSDWLTRVLALIEDERGQRVLVLEHLDGTSLYRLLRYIAEQDERLGEGAVLHIGVALLGAITQAHAARDAKNKFSPLVHGQLGPHQVLISWEGDVSIMGFGLNVVFERSTEKTPGWLLPFVAPEVRDGQPVTIRSNVYSAGAMLWSLLSRQALPADGTRPPPLRRVRPDLPSSLTFPLDRALEPKASRRIGAKALQIGLSRAVDAADREELRWAMEVCRVRCPVEEEFLPYESFPPTASIPVAESLSPPTSSFPPSDPPSQPAADPHDPATAPHQPAADPHDPATVPHQPAADPHDPATVPHQPAAVSHYPVADDATRKYVRKDVLRDAGIDGPLPWQRDQRPSSQAPDEDGLDGVTREDAEDKPRSRRAIRSTRQRGRTFLRVQVGASANPQKAPPPRKPMVTEPGMPSPKRAKLPDTITSLRGSGEPQRASSDGLAPRPKRAEPGMSASARVRRADTITSLRGADQLSGESAGAPEGRPMFPESDTDGSKPAKRRDTVTNIWGADELEEALVEPRQDRPRVDEPGTPASKRPQTREAITALRLRGAAEAEALPPDHDKVEAPSPIASLVHDAVGSPPPPIVEDLLPKAGQAPAPDDSLEETYERDESYRHAPSPLGAYRRATPMPAPAVPLSAHVPSPVQLYPSSYRPSSPATEMPPPSQRDAWRWVVVVGVTAVACFALGVAVASSGVELRFPSEGSADPSATSPPPEITAPVPVVTVTRPKAPAEAGSTAPGAASAVPPPGPEDVGTRSVPVVTEDAGAAALPGHRGYIVVYSPIAGAHVYSHGAHAGPLGQRLEVSCGVRYVRLGSPPPIAWLEPGQAMLIKCRRVTTFSIEASTRKLLRRPKPKKRQTPASMYRRD